MERYEATRRPRATSLVLDKLSFFILEKIDESSFFGILYSTITCASCQRATITELITIFSFSTRGWEPGSLTTNNQADHGDHGDLTNDHGSLTMVSMMTSVTMVTMVIMGHYGDHVDQGDHDDHVNPGGSYGYHELGCRPLDMVGS